MGIAGLHSQSLSRFTLQTSARVLQNLQPSIICRMIAVATYVEEYWYVHRFEWWNTLIYAHTTSRTFPPCDFSLVSLTLPATEAGDLEK